MGSGDSFKGMDEFWKAEMGRAIEGGNCDRDTRAEEYRFYTTKSNWTITLRTTVCVGQHISLFMSTVDHIAPLSHLPCSTQIRNNESFINKGKI